ncbi:MAG: hypothetical protein IPO62_04585 [Saprospiraceae bacterium]|nr:hypothetical protein [Saprospiraceae bacterium]
MTIIVILIFMSLVALLTIHWTLYNKYSFSFSPEGIDNYLTSFGQYKALFTATVATIGAYFGLHRLKAATDANSDKLKQDHFSEWKTVLDIRFIEIEKADPFMRREFTRVRYNLFRQLYDLNFSITNNTQLTQIFQSTFQDLARFFEEQNNRHIGMGGVYPTNKYSYSFDSFRFLFLGSVDTIYPEIGSDLQTLYLAALDPNRMIDANMFPDSTTKLQTNIRQW